MGPECSGCGVGSRDRALRAVGAAGLGSGSLLGFALLPKCPLCIAAYLTAGPLALYAWLGALGLGVALLARRAFVRRGAARLTGAAALGSRT